MIEQSKPTSPHWNTGSGKYEYSASGKTDVLFIVFPSMLGLSREVKPRRYRKKLSENEQEKLESEGVARDCHSSDLSIMKARFRCDKEKNISEEMTGGSLKCEEVKKTIMQLMDSTKAEGGKLYTSSQENRLYFYELV